MQSFRAYGNDGKIKHLYNALKYFLSLCVTGLAVAHTTAYSSIIIGEVCHIFLLIFQCRRGLCFFVYVVRLVTWLFGSFIFLFVLRYSLCSLITCFYYFLQQIFKSKKK